MSTTQNTSSDADTITVLTCLGQDSHASKHWYLNGTGGLHCNNYSLGKWFSVDQFWVNGLEDLWGVLDHVSKDARSFVIRGDPKPGVNLDRTIRRAIKKGEEQPTFIEPEKGHQWLMLDWDTKDIPFDPGRPLDAVQNLLGQLPAPFRECQTLYQLSSSAGFKKGLRVHLWYWLDRPYPKKMLDAYFKTLSLQPDLSLFRAVQPHYTAAPMLGEGVYDPITGPRLGLLGFGGRDTLQLPIVEASVQTPVETPQTTTPDRPAEWTPEQLERCLRSLPVEEYGDYERWITMCAAANYATGGAGLDVFTHWCMGNPMYVHKAAEIARHWSTFGVDGANLITTATLKREFFMRSGRHWDETRPEDDFASIAQEQVSIPGVGGHWMDGVLVSSKGQVLKDFHNILKILEQHPDTAGLFAYNERDMMVYYTRVPVWSLGKRPLAHPIGDEDFSYVTAWFNYTVRCPVGVDSVARGVIGVARRNRYDPFLDWLMSLQWDGVPRLDTWLVDYAKSEDSRYIRAVGRCFILSAVARTFRPGAKVDTMLILGGRQGAGKSTMLRNLVGPDYFTDHLDDIQGKDARMQAHGPVLIEVAELEAFNKTQTTAIKSFISTQVDRFRAPYERTMSRQPRRCVFAGSTNQDTYLKDETGGRRFWPCVVGYCVDNEGLLEVREQLWAEAVWAHQQGEHWWLSEADEIEARIEQEAHREVDSWEEAFAIYLALDKERAIMQRGLETGLAETCFDENGRREWTAVNELLTYCVGLPIGNHKSPDQRRAAKALRVIGWIAERVRVDGVRVRRYVQK